MSVSIRENPPLNKRVPLLKIKMSISSLKLFRKKKFSINKKIPAATRVDLWTRAEIGVGAAIASGSQVENGYWALFVIRETKKIKMKIKFKKFLLSKKNSLKKPNTKNLKIKPASPIRLVRIVIAPPLSLLKFK